jgi:hypothetical protein
MVTFLLSVALLISVILNIGMFRLIKILFKKIKIYEEWIIEFRDDVSNTLDHIKQIDNDATFKSSFDSSGKGIFESDDQVGQVFKDLSDIIIRLNDKIQ